MKTLSEAEQAGIADQAAAAELVIVAVCASAKASPVSADALQDRLRSLADLFVGLLRQCGAPLWRYAVASVLDETCWNFVHPTIRGANRC